MIPFRRFIRKGLGALILLGVAGVFNPAQALDENSDTVSGCAGLFTFHSREFSLCAAITHLSAAHPGCFSAGPDVIVSAYVNQTSQLLPPDTVASQIGQEFIQEESCSFSRDDLRTQFDAVLKNSPAARGVFYELISQVMPDSNNLTSVLVPADTIFQEKEEIREIFGPVKIHLHSDAADWLVKNKLNYLLAIKKRLGEERFYLLVRHLLVEEDSMSFVKQLLEKDNLFMEATSALDPDSENDLAMVLHPRVEHHKLTTSWQRMIKASLKGSSRYALFIYREEDELPVIESYIRKHRQPFARQKQVCLGGISEPVFDKRGPVYKCAALFRRE